MSFTNGDKVRYVGPKHDDEDPTVYTVDNVTPDGFVIRWDTEIGGNHFATYTSKSSNYFVLIEEEEVIPVRTRFEVGDTVASIRFNTTAVVARIDRDANALGGTQYDRIEYGSGGWDRSTDLYLVSRPIPDDGWITVSGEDAKVLREHASSLNIEFRTITQYRVGHVKKED